MADLSKKRIFSYAAVGLLVAGVGLWGLRGGAASGPPPEVTVVGVGSAAPEGAVPPAGAGGSAVSSGPPQDAVTTTSPPRWFVQVAGAVRRPGVYEVEPGARVFQVLLLAGGATEAADPEALPLAAAVGDGARIYVPRLGEDASPDPLLGVGAVGGAQTPADGTPAQVSLSTAGEAELDTLPGIGPKTARQIIAYREANGPFHSVDDLEAVPGIGPATVERLRGSVVP